MRGGFVLTLAWHLLLYLRNLKWVVRPSGTWKQKEPEMKKRMSKEEKALRAAINRHATLHLGAPTVDYREDPGYQTAFAAYMRRHYPAPAGAVR